jgi:hypothetical protein
MIDRQSGVPIALGLRTPLTSLIQTLAVAEHLSFCRAANALAVSQSSVSARNKALEEEPGIVLFERNAGGVRFTEAAGRHDQGRHPAFAVGHDGDFARPR